MLHLQNQIPQSYTLVRRPSRDEREDALPEVRDEDGRVMAVVEEIPADCWH
jgi:hypothetical protein